MAREASGGGATTCKRCGAQVAANDVCPSCGLPSNAAFSRGAPTKPLVPPPPPPPGRKAIAVPPAPQPAASKPAAPARPVSNKVACALCMQSMPRESAVVVDNEVAQSIGAAMAAQCKGQSICPNCLETLRTKAARAGSPAGDAPPPVASSAPAPDPNAAPVANTAPGEAPAAPAVRKPGAEAKAMPPHFWLAGGLAGALVGAAVYLGIFYGTGYRWSPVIILVGGLIGIGVRLGAQACTGAGPGAVAAVLTILTGFTTSYIIASSEAAQWRREAEAEMQNHLLSQIAYTICEEKENRGEELGPIPLDEDENAEDTTENMFPRDVWHEAQGRWGTLAEDEKERRRREYMGDTDEGEDSVTVFHLIFEVWALVWFGIAAATAYKAGAGV